MKDTYIYDIEVYPNLFTVIFLSINTKQELIDKYINLDKAGKCKKTILKEMNPVIFEIGERRNDIYLLVD